MNPICVGNIECLFVRRETQAVRPPEIIGDCPDTPGPGFESVKLVWQLRLWAEPLLRAVNRVGEPDRPVRFDHDIVDRVEPSSVIAVHEHLGLVRRIGLHGDETALGRMISLIAEKYAVLVVDTSVGHDYVGLDPFFRPGAGILSSQLVDHNQITIVLSWFASVACDK